MRWDRYDTYLLRQASTASYVKGRETDTWHEWMDFGRRAPAACMRNREPGTGGKQAERSKCLPVLSKALPNFAAPCHTHWTDTRAMSQSRRSGRTKATLDRRAVVRLLCFAVLCYISSPPSSETNASLFSSASFLSFFLFLLALGCSICDHSAWDCNEHSFVHLSVCRFYIYSVHTYSVLCWLSALLAFIHPSILLTTTSTAIWPEIR